MAGNSQSVDGVDRNAFTLEGLSRQVAGRNAEIDRRFDELDRRFAEIMRRLPPPHLKEEEARSQKREARIQKVETWISSLDTFNTLTEIKVKPRKIQDLLTSIAQPPPPSKPAAPVLSLPDDLVPSIILKETTKHEDEDFSPPIDTFDSGPIWDKEGEEKEPKAILMFS